MFVGPQSYGGHQANYGQGQGQMSGQPGASYTGSQPQYVPQSPNTGGSQQAYNTGMGNNGGNNNTGNNPPYQATPTSQTGSQAGHMTTQGGTMGSVATSPGHMTSPGTSTGHVTSQHSQATGQQGNITGQQGHMTGQQGHMTGQQGHMTGQQGHMTGQQGGHVTGYNQPQHQPSSQGYNCSDFIIE